MSSSIGTFLKFNKPSNLTVAHVLADQIFTTIARISMENPEVLTLLVEMLEEGADGEQSLQEPLTEALLRSMARHVEIIRDEPVTGYPEGEKSWHDHKYCRDCRECVTCGIRPCFHGMGHTPE